MSFDSAATAIVLSRLLVGHAFVGPRPPPEVATALSAGTDIDDSFAPIAFETVSAANAASGAAASRDAAVVEADLALVRTLALVNSGISADEERSLASRLSTERATSNAVRLLMECVESPSVRLPAKRFALLALGALGDRLAVQRALHSGQPALMEAALNAIDWWTLPGFEADLLAVARGKDAQWLREYAEDLLG